MSADTAGRDRTNRDTKERGTVRLQAMSLSEPNATTAKALEELEAGKGKRLDSANALFEDLGM